MKRLIILAGWIGLAASALGLDYSTRLEKAAVLPLSLDEHFQFRKTEMFLDDPILYKPTVNEMINFERQRVNFKAVDNIDRQARYGQYFHFFWRTSAPADLVVRFEYRQEKLGSYVQAKETGYTKVKGSHETDFRVVGDDYLQDGRITAWRALMIQNGKIVALTQSYLWN